MSQHTTTAETETSPLAVTITRSIVIQRSAGEVFAILENYARDPEWRRAVEEMAQEPAVTRVGTATHERLRFHGEVYETDAVVTDYEPGRLVAFRTTASAVPIAGWRQVEPIGGDASQVTLHIAFALPAAQQAMAALLESSYTAQIDDDLRCLKELMERPGR